MTSPLRTTAPLTLGSRSAWACASRALRSRSSCSGAGKGSESSWNQLDRLLDVVVGEVEVRDRAQDARPPRRRERDAAVPELLERIGDGEPEGADVYLDEVRLDPLQIDRYAARDEPLR